MPIQQINEFNFKNILQELLDNNNLNSQNSALINKLNIK